MNNITAVNFDGNELVLVRELDPSTIEFYLSMGEGPEYPISISDSKESSLEELIRIHTIQSQNNVQAITIEELHEFYLLRTRHNNLSKKVWPWKWYTNDECKMFDTVNWERISILWNKFFRWTWDIIKSITPDVIESPIDNNIFTVLKKVNDLLVITGNPNDNHWRGNFQIQTYPINRTEEKSPNEVNILPTKTFYLGNPTISIGHWVYDFEKMIGEAK